MRVVRTPGRLGGRPGKLVPLRTAWNVYVDSTSSYVQDFGSSISANLALSPGTHSVHVRAWDSTGAYGGETISLTVP